MKVRFILEMKSPVVHGQSFDSITIDWEEEAPRDEIMRLCQKWISGRNFLKAQMNGLSEVGESSLEAKPVEEEIV